MSAFKLALNLDTKIEDYLEKTGPENDWRAVALSVIE